MRREYDECWKSLVKSAGITAPALKCCSVIGWQEQELLIGHKKGSRSPTGASVHDPNADSDSTPIYTQTHSRHSDHLKFSARVLLFLV